MRRMAFVLMPLFILNLAIANGRKVSVKIGGMTCPSCAASVEEQIRKLKEVDEVEISLSNGTGLISIKDGKTLGNDVIREAIEKSGFKAVSIHPKD